LSVVGRLFLSGLRLSIVGRRWSVIICRSSVVRHRQLSIVFNLRHQFSFVDRRRFRSSLRLSVVGRVISCKIFVCARLRKICTKCARLCPAVHGCARLCTR
jgi:hypothetical protein